MTAARIILPLLVLAASGAGAAWFFLNTKEAETRTPPPQTLRVDAIRLAPDTYPVVLHSRGTVRPRTESTLIPEVSGRIVSVSPTFREGEFFEQGDILLEIERLDYQTAVTIAKASVAQAAVVLEEEEARAEQALENWKQLGGNSAPPGDLVLRKPQVAEAEALLASAQAGLEKALRDLDRTQIRAPYAGRILDQNVDVGQYVSPGTVLARIFAVDYVEIRLPLSSRQLAFIDLPEQYRNGDEASIQDAEARPPVTLSGNFGGTIWKWQGHIVRVEGALDERSRQLCVIAHVDDPYARTDDGRPPLKIGLFVEAAIEGRTLTDVFVLPRNAVRAGGEVILVIGENKLQRTPLEPLWSDEKSIIIGAGPGSPVQTGTLLCTTPLSFPADGISVIPHVAGEAPPQEPEATGDKGEKGAKGPKSTGP